MKFWTSTLLSTNDITALNFHLVCFRTTVWQTVSVRQFWPAPACTLHKNRNVRRTRLLAISCTRTRTWTRTFFYRNFQKKLFLLVKNKSVRTWVAHPHLKGVCVHTHTSTHISENLSAPIRTKIAAPASARNRFHTNSLQLDSSKASSIKIENFLTITTLLFSCDWYHGGCCSVNLLFISTKHLVQDLAFTVHII